MSKPSPARYRTTNWKSYNEALKRRGSLLIWLDKDMVWQAPKAGRMGRPPVFSDAAIQFCLIVKVLFGLPLRQTTGMVSSILQMAGLDWPVPDFSTLSRRQKTITVEISSRRAAGPLNLLVDSTGIKFLGDGEWLARKHGTHRRRQYRKVHLALDTGSGDILAVEFTSSREGDSPVLPDLLEQIPPDQEIGTVTGDGAFDIVGPRGLTHVRSKTPPTNRRLCLPNRGHPHTPRVYRRVDGCADPRCGRSGAAAGGLNENACAPSECENRCKSLT